MPRPRTSGSDSYSPEVTLTLEAIVQHYCKHFRPRAKAELDWLRDQPTFSKAIEYAAHATDRYGRRFSHQSRLRLKDLAAAQEKLLSNAMDISEQNTFERLRRRISGLLIPVFGDRRLDQIGVQELEEYKNQKLKEGYSKKTINNHLAALGKMLSLA
jgi:hypothetical protein